jgi:hypothetical protein
MSARFPPQRAGLMRNTVVISYPDDTAWRGR